MIRIAVRILPALLFPLAAVFPQDTLKIMDYNLLNYVISDTSRDTYFRTTLSYVNPDILVVEEITSQAAVDNFRNNVLNNCGIGTFQSPTFIDGPDTDAELFYRDSKVSVVSTTAINTALRNIYQFKVTHTISNKTFYIYAVHLKASSGSTYEKARRAEVDSLRKVTNALPIGSYFMVMGDFNFYGSTEPGYQGLLQDNAGDDGNFVDAITMTGTWNNAIYAPYHTQSPRTRSFGGGATGGLDDRFDLILFSNAINSSGTVSYVTGSMTAVGNDGNHYNDSINQQPNTAVPVIVANALHYGSDHLPVCAKFVFPNHALAVTLSSFTASASADAVTLRWNTATEVKNYGFEIERKLAEDPRSSVWFKTGFVKGKGNSSTITPYSYTDRSITVSAIYSYRLRQIDDDGTDTYSPAIDVTIDPPKQFELSQNMPNPFNPSTVIKYAVRGKDDIRLSVFNILGEEVARLDDGERAPGNYAARWNASGCSSGIYFAVLRTSTSVLTRKMVLIR